MTKHECAIVMAYTGYAMLTGDDIYTFYEYLEGIMGRPVNTLELAWESTWVDLHEKSKEDFLKLCAEASDE